VYLANYPVATDNNAAYYRQRDLIDSALQTYGTDHIGGVTVGNEFMLKYRLPNLYRANGLITYSNIQLPD